MATYTTEIASDSIVSDNPIHQRLLKAYILAEEHMSGVVLELGCGEGRGVELLAPKASRYLGLDKIAEVIERLSEKHKNTSLNLAFEQAIFPPLKNLEEASFDRVVSFQVIEHVKADRQFLEEIYRVLKPGGKALITTPNIRKTLTRNPWHIREYLPEQLENLAADVFDSVEMKGIGGNEKVMEYYDQNKASVEKITRWDLLNLQYRLPAWILRIPYDLLNRLNRNKLDKGDSSLVRSIHHSDYLLMDKAEDALDLFAILHKK